MAMAENSSPKVKETHCNFVHLTGALNLESLSNLLIAIWGPNWSDSRERGRADENIPVLVWQLQLELN